MVDLFPRISIVTPSYNQGQYLEETILSVLNQGYPNLEYFVMDGGSTDNSVEIIQKYASKLTYWESKPDRGQSHAINKGFKMATGELVAWINSDDQYTPGAFFEVASIWKEDKSVGFIHGVSELIDEFGNPKGKTFGAELSVLDALTAYENLVAQQSTFINRTVLEKVGYLNEDYHMAMDWDLWLRVGCQFKAKSIDKVWSRYRIWSDTKTEKLMISSIPEQQIILKNILRNENIHLSFSQKRAIFAVFWGKKAVDYHKAAESFNCWKAICLSLLFSPGLKGGASKRILYATPVITFLRRARNRVVALLN